MGLTNGTTPPPASATEPRAGRTPDAWPRWLVILGILLRLVWPLVMLGAGVSLFIVMGGCGWLWLVLCMLVVCGVLARPPRMGG